MQWQTQDQKKGRRKLHITAEKSVTAKKAMTNRDKREFTSHCRIAAKTNFLMLLLCPARFAHARYSSRMIDRFLNWGDHGKPKSGKIKGRCQPPLGRPILICMRWFLSFHSFNWRILIFTSFSFLAKIRNGSSPFWSSCSHASLALFLKKYISNYLFCRLSGNK